MNQSGSAVAIVIVTYNSGDQLGECLDSLVDGCAGVDVREVVVVDNASADDSVAIAESYEGLPLRVVKTGRNAGYAAGLNAGVASLPLDEIGAVLLLNPDIRMRPGALGPLLEVLDNREGSIAAPRLVNVDGTLQPSLRRPPAVGGAVAEAVLGGRIAAGLGWGELVADPVVYTRPATAAWSTGAAMLMSSKVLREVGPWDESLLLYGEETDFALRARAAGHVLRYEPRSEMVHLSGDAYATNAELYALMTVNKVRVYRRWHGRVRSSAFYGAVTLGVAVRAAAGRRPARRGLTALVRPATRLRALPG